MVLHEMGASSITSFDHEHKHTSSGTFLCCMTRIHGGVLLTLHEVQ